MKVGALHIPASLLAINPHLREAAPAARRSRPSPMLGTPTATRDAGGLVVEVPGLALKVTLNSRMHWSKRGAAVAAQRAAVRSAMRFQTCPSLPCEVTITRVGPRVLDDDNAVASCKGVRDAVAAWLGVDDGDARVTWRIVREQGPYSVRIGVRAC